MIISLDYDDTYTKDPLMWNWFAKQAMDRGHTVYCVSARSERDMDDPKATIGRVIGPDNCFGTNLMAKRTFMEQHKRIKVNVWIDDLPEMIVDTERLNLYI